MMSSTLEKITAEAMKLSPTERADLADLLWTSTASAAEVDAAWEAEIQRRIADLEAHRTEAVPAEGVLAEVRAMIDASQKR
jgi:putative addiction module component (TIGR02574 family)